MRDKYCKAMKIYFQEVTNFAKIFLTFVLSFSLFVSSSYGKAEPGDEQWLPKTSERLIKLPAKILKKSVNKDFKSSELAIGLDKNQKLINLKVKTLGDISVALNKTQDERLETELRHQYLAEKQAYLKLVEKNQRLRRAKASTKLKLYKGILKKLIHENGLQLRQNKKIELLQKTARKRFEKNISKVDQHLLELRPGKKSKYEKKYAANSDAIQRLVNAINMHPLSQRTEKSDSQYNKAEFLREEIYELEATLAILGQEKQILGHMAKIVALDARALAESLADHTDNRRGLDGSPEALKFFVN
ncbi:MAG: hypothetical protein CMM44_03345 [Rhodospirillaceae bacterium]|nr:hypothetical protein [Rhodospirillaceae bacterium]|tara:strand:+ start:9669 stop:10577 length:909 start_codon:yes stop_codon:yes gene_type:complete